MRTIDADALIDDLKHDVAVDQDSLDYEELTDSNRENIQFDKDCKQNAIDLLQHAPTIEPQQMWIPCSERLPEDEQNVLVTYKTTDKIHPCQYHADGSKNPWYSYIDQCRAHMNVVLAWMPLPEPYREEGD